MWLVDNNGGVGCHSMWFKYYSNLLLAKRSGVVGILHYVDTHEELSKFLTSATEPRVLVLPAKLLVNQDLLSAIKTNTTESSRVEGLLVLESENPQSPFSPTYVLLALNFVLN